MKLFHYLALLCLAHSCSAGFLIIPLGFLIGEAAEWAAVIAGEVVASAAIGEAAADAVFGSAIAEVFGVTSVAGFDGSYVIMNGGLYAAGNAAAGQTLLAAGAVAGTGK